MTQRKKLRGNNEATQEEVRYLVYCRKSSESDERQVLSIQSQINVATGVAKQLKLKTVGEPICESKSAKLPDKRPYFNSLLGRISKGEAEGIICWKIDRLARNPDEAGKIMGMLGRGEIRHIRTAEKDYYSKDNSLLQYVEFGIADQYSRDLSENVKRGLKTKAEMGYPPGVAKIGYLNDKTADKGQRKIYSDKERFGLVNKVWEAFLSGKYSVNKLAKFARNDLGLKTLPRKKEGGKLISKSYLYRLLRDPFYAGFFYHAGKRYEVNKSVQRMISEEDFWQAQQMLGRKGLPQPKKHPPLYNIFMRCGFCDGAASPDFKFQLICECKYKFSCVNKTNCPKCGIKIDRIKNPKYLHYVYYKCNRKKDPSCPGGSIEQKDADKFISKYLSDNLAISRDLSKWCIRYLRELNEEEVKSQETVYLGWKRDYELTRAKRENLIHLRLENRISDEDYERLKNELEGKIEATKQRLESLEGEAGAWMNKAEKTFDLAQRLVEISLSGTVEEKKEILSQLGSNLKLRGKELSISNAPQFELLLKGLAEAKAENPRFEPKNIEDLSDENEVLDSVRPTLLRR